MAEFNIERMPPHNTEAEQALLGSCMIDHECIDSLTLEPADFYDIRHQKIYESMLYLHKKETPIDIQTLSARLKAKKSLTQVGGHGYLASLANQVPTAARAKHYEKLVGECSLRRKLIDKAYKIIGNAYEESKGIEEVLEFADKEITGVLESDNLGEYKTPEMSDLLNEYTDYYNSGKPSGISLGIEAFDKEFISIPKGEVATIQAPTGGSKTTIALNIGYNIAKSGKKVMYINLENPKNLLIERLVSIVGGIDSYRIKGREFKDGEINTALDKMYKTGFVLSSPPTATVSQIERLALLEKRKRGLDLLIIDHLHLIKSGISDATQRVGENAEGVKAIARKLDIPIIELAQINRYAQMQGKKPEKTDIRDSSVVENTAGLMLALQFNNTPDITLTPDERQLDIHILKNRYGIEKVVSLKFNWRNLQING